MLSKKNNNRIKRIGRINQFNLLNPVVNISTKY